MGVISAGRMACMEGPLSAVTWSGGILPPGDRRPHTWGGGILPRTKSARLTARGYSGSGSWIVVGGGGEPAGVCLLKIAKEDEQENRKQQENRISARHVECGGLTPPWIR